MDIESMAQDFLQSDQGANASAALTQQGLGPDQVQEILAHSARAGAEHVEQAHQDNGGILGEHAGLGFFAAFAAGVVRGDGIAGSLEDGALGVVIARITEALTARMGLDSALADSAAAATAPYVMAFLEERIGL
jgi:hypothetical protein